MQSFVRNAVSGAEGDGAEVRRLFPVPSLMNFDPFVLWDDFSISAGAGFPDHPHRGFEGVTYVFQGSVKHKDNLGNDSTVTSGGLQRFTAGSGIVHSEMPSADGVTRGIQMWVNLPLRLKKLEPDYQQVNSDEVPERKVNNGIVRVLAGESSPLQLNTPVIYLDARLDAGGEFEQAIPSGYRGIVYIVEGACDVNGDIIRQGKAAFMENVDTIKLRCNEPSRIMLCFGQPHGEPIRQHGPFVD
ncbi:MAG: pirin family protein [Gammaproteobacteria bacterium]|jgi:redox-sensitive bicupin YhaK (pirin superfamily)